MSTTTLGGTFTATASTTISSQANSRDLFHKLVYLSENAVVQSILTELAK